MRLYTCNLQIMHLISSFLMNITKVDKLKKIVFFINLIDKLLVFRISDQLRHRLACSVLEICYSLEILDIETTEINNKGADQTAHIHT